MTNLDAKVLSERLEISMREALLELRTLSIFAAGCTRIDLVRDPKLVSGPGVQMRYREALKKRLAGEPLAYITGYSEFYGENLAINSNVLCPRPDTELLVDCVISKVSGKPDPKILELGTGSGAISIALAKSVSSLKIVATDISNEACNVARNNIKTSRVSHRVSVIKSDWFSEIHSRFDVIVSNPPYVEEGDPHLKKPGVRFEPKLALVGGKDGLAEIREIIGASIMHLYPDGWLCFEHGYDQGRQCRALLKDRGFRSIFTERDLSGNERVSGGKI